MFSLLFLKSLWEGASLRFCFLCDQTLGVEIEINLAKNQCRRSLITILQFDIVHLHCLFLVVISFLDRRNVAIFQLSLLLHGIRTTLKILNNFIDLMPKDCLLLPVNLDVGVLVHADRRQLALQMLDLTKALLGAKDHVVQFFEFVEFLFDIGVVCVVAQPFGD